MMKSPYSQFNTSVEKQTVEQTTKKQPFNIKTLLVCLTVGYLVFVNLSGNGKVIDDEKEYIDDIVLPDDGDSKDKKTEPDKEKVVVDLKDSYLVRIYETEASSGDVWFVNFLNEDAFWFDWIKSKGMRLYTYDPGSNKEQSQTFVKAAESRGISEPFVIHAKNGKVLTVTAIDESLTIDKLKEIVESSGK